MTDPLSDGLLNFIAQSPYSRQPQITFLRRVAAELPSGASIVDVGAGDAPYREFFSHANYLTLDWENSFYHPTRAPDLVAHADQIPLESGSLDAILCTQVLEHLAEPWLALAEFFRVLKPGGRLLMTTPLAWYLHEQPYDFYRYTSHGLRFLLERAGFSDIEIIPLNDSFSTLAQLVTDLGWMIGRHPDGYDDQRDLVSRAMTHVASLIGSFSGFDTQWILPLSYSTTAIRPNPGSGSNSV